MNFKNIVTAALLAGCAIGASAASVTVHGVDNSLDVITDGDVYDPIGSWSLSTGSVRHPNPTTSVTYADIIGFTLDEQEAVTAKLTTTNLSGVELLLYQGDFALGDSLSSFASHVVTSSSSTIFQNLAAGDYFFVVEGTLSKGATPTGQTAYGSYDLQISVVPEPANVALLLAGIGLFGVVAKRRKIVG